MAADQSVRCTVHPLISPTFLFARSIERLKLIRPINNNVLRCVIALHAIHTRRSSLHEH